MLFPGYEEQLRLANEESLDPVLSNEERLYFKVSDEKDFSDCHEDLEQNCNKLEREYFEVLHIKNVAPNERYVDTPVLVYSEPIKDFEEAHFHEYNVTPNRPCSAFFKTDSFMPAAEIFDALCKDGLKPEHLRCLQRKPTGEIFVTFHRVQSSFHPSSYCEVVWYWHGHLKNMAACTMVCGITVFTPAMPFRPSCALGNSRLGCITMDRCHHAVKATELGTMQLSIRTLF